MSKHTPGRLYASAVTGHGIGLGQRMRLCSKERVVADHLTPADAAHIVDCWNACKGIDPEAVPELVAAAEKLLRKLEQWEDDDEEDYPVPHEREGLDAAVDRAKGAR